MKTVLNENAQLELIRMDTSTSEVQEAELFDLMLQKRNLTYDALESKQQALTFTTLERLLHEKLGITQTDQNILISLGLFKGGKFNTAAELLSGDNDLGNATLDIIRFGETTSIFLDRIRTCNPVPVEGLIHAGS